MLRKIRIAKFVVIVSALVAVYTPVLITGAAALLIANKLNRGYAIIATPPVKAGDAKQKEAQWNLNNTKRQAMMFSQTIPWSA
jgi:hypothetical protein